MDQAIPESVPQMRDEPASIPYDQLTGWQKTWRFIRRNPTMVAGGFLLLIMVLLAIFAPYLWTVDPIEMKPGERLRAPSVAHWFGTDMYGRDSFSRVVYGGRVSLFVGLVVGVITSAIGLAIGLVSGFLRRLDNVIMRAMDGIMALPDLLLAISFVALTEASVRNVIIALVIPQIPRVVRLVRGIVLTLREQPFIEAAQALGSRLPRVLLRHLLPNTLAPLIVQCTYVMASAVLIEAGLSFLGAGTPPEIPSWGNIMAEARSYVRVAFWLLLFPGLFLATTVLSINLVGDGLRDMLDPRLAKRMR
jgi:peptide/nickel transport system permease protein